MSNNNNPNKLKLQTRDFTAENIAKLNELFPSLVCEGKVNLDALRAFVGEKVQTNEAYELTWVGKRQAIAEAGRPTRKTLRPCVDESIDFDTTGNLYIEGDNLDVLKLLQESYLGKVKMIYIDPPYNTGNDFIYNDSFRSDDDEYNEEVEYFDDDGHHNFRENNSSNPRFHSDWCSMIYPRLQLARNLLRDDGVIFISIDDNEIINVMKLCDEVFGACNKVGIMTIQSNPRGSQASKHLSNVHEYIVMYAKDSSSLELKGVSKGVDVESEYQEVDERCRRYRLLGLRQRGGAWKKEDRPAMHYPIYINPQNGSVSLNKDDLYSIEVIPKRPTGELSRWTWGKDKLRREKAIIVGRRVNRSGQNEAWDVFRKDYMDNDDGTEKNAKIKTMWVEKEINYQNAKNEIKDLFGNSEMFDFPKPTYIVETLASMLFCDNGDVILDFFSGSATTAQAVMQLNSKDGGNRKFICVQLPETLREKSEAHKSGYKNICEIGKERIRRAGRQILELSLKSLASFPC